MPGVDPAVLRWAARFAGLGIMIASELWLKDRISMDLYGKVLAAGAALVGNTYLSFGQVDLGELNRLAESSVPPPEGDLH